MARIVWELRKPMSKTLSVLFAIVESEFVSVEPIHNWSMGLIADLPDPAAWLIDLLGSNDLESMSEVLLSIIREYDLSFDKQYQELELGFFYLKYMKNKLSLVELEVNLLDIIDPYNVDDLDPEKINEVFKEENNRKNIDLLLKDKLSKYSKKSEEAYDFIFSNRCLEQEPYLFLESEVSKQKWEIINKG